MVLLAEQHTAVQQQPQKKLMLLLEAAATSSGGCDQIGKLDAAELLVPGYTCTHSKTPVWLERYDVPTQELP